MPSYSHSYGRRFFARGGGQGVPKKVLELGPRTTFWITDFAFWVQVGDVSSKLSF